LKFPPEGLIAMQQEVLSGKTLFVPYVPYQSPMLYDTHTTPWHIFTFSKVVAASILDHLQT